MEEKIIPGKKISEKKKDPSKEEGKSGRIRRRRSYLEGYDRRRRQIDRRRRHKANRRRKKDRRRRRMKEKKT